MPTRVFCSVAGSGRVWGTERVGVCPVSRSLGAQVPVSPGSGRSCADPAAGHASRRDAGRELPHPCIALGWEELLSSLKLCWEAADLHRHSTSRTNI